MYKNAVLILYIIMLINHRVQNIEGLVSKLKANGVTVLDSIEVYDYGKFVHILKPGNYNLIIFSVTALLSIKTVTKYNPLFGRLR